uniref:Trehalose 6-phosphate phosphatase n=1 Tax=Oryza punctata TaxID=4537 RepID=A0A0E0M1G4_ORYPU
MPHHRHLTPSHEEHETPNPSLTPPMQLALASDEPPPPPPTPSTSPEQSPRRIVVAHRLPLNATPDPGSPFGFAFSLSADAHALQLSHGLSLALVVFVGTLPSEAARSLQRSDELDRYLLEGFSCVPVFLPPRVHDEFYVGFCKHYLWPRLHYLLPHAPATNGDLHFDGELYRSYASANRSFASRVVEVLSPDDGDLVFVHDYHLWLLPSFLRRGCPRCRIGFFLHSPFPSAEVFRSIPVREDLLRALLNADLVGFHTYDYARHFLSACSRLLGLTYTSRHGRVGINYHGRTVLIKILSVGVDMGLLRTAIASPEAVAKFREITEVEYKGRVLMVGVDDVDIFKGVRLKLLAMENLLETYPVMRGRVVLVQIHNPARCGGRDVERVRGETAKIQARINARFGAPGYQPVVIVDRAAPMAEKVAYYAAAECCVVSAVRDGLNRIPYFYTVCREEGPVAKGAAADQPRHSAIVLSEFVGCSPSLSGAIRVNPWNIEAMAEAMYDALTINVAEKQARHVKHYTFLKLHDVIVWARSFAADLQLACKDRSRMRTIGMGIGASYRVVAVDAAFKKLPPELVNPAYRAAAAGSSRLILLDYDGTLEPTGAFDNAPSDAVIVILNELCSDTKNVVFIVSGRSKDELERWFAPCANLGIAAEHGYFIRWSRDAPWETMASKQLTAATEWKAAAENVMRHYAEATDGSYIETKETGMVWRYEDADPRLAPLQAKELLDHLATVLASEPVAVRSGCQIVEVIPQGVSKGVAAECIVSAMASRRGGAPGFVLCVGDDRSDEDMFGALASLCGGGGSSSSSSSTTISLLAAAQVFACTVGNKPSMASYYLNDKEEVVDMLHGLAFSSPSARLHAAATPRRPADFEIKSYLLRC